MINIYRRALPIVAALTAFGLLCAGPARADTNLEIAPTSWRMQDYLSGGLVIYYTGSTCAQQELILPTATPTDSVNRFWSAVLYAKSANKLMGIFYDPSTCYITSFYVKEG